MTFAASLGFQDMVQGALETAFPTIPVHSMVPVDAPDRYIRIDGFTTSPEQAHKTEEQAQHGLTVHVIDAPEAGTKSLVWVKQNMAIVQAALVGLKYDANSRGMICESGRASLEPKGDSLNDAHGVMRYTSIITGA